MHSFLGKVELRKLFPTVTLVVVVLLAAVTVLGIQQYHRYGHCEEILSRSDQIIFQFTSIKEHLNESLVAGKTINARKAGDELLGFERELKSISDDIAIPEEFKISFLSQVDLMGLVVQLRAISDSSSSLSIEQLGRLTTSLNHISNYLLQFHTLLDEHTRSLLLGLYNVIIGSLALILFLTSTVLLLIHRSVAVPIMRLATTIVSPAEEAAHGPLKAGTLPASVQSLTSHLHRQQARQRQLDHFRICLNNLLQTLPESFDHQDDWETLCSVLQTNPDYFLVWVGQYPHQGHVPTPITGCGCVSSSPSQCRQTIEHFIEFCHQEGSLCDSARKALDTEATAIVQTSYDGIPLSLRKALALESQSVVSASFPINGPNGDVDTIVTVYRSEGGSFSDLEVSALEFLCLHIGQLRRQHQARAQTPDRPETAPVPAELYSLAIAGELSSSMAHEITNLSNGSLNYAQALVDLNTACGEREDELLLLEKLHGEERKISRLAADFNQLVSPEPTAVAGCSPERLITSIQHLVQGRFRQKRIVLKTALAQDLPRLSGPLIEIQVVLLTLIHQAEANLSALARGEDEARIELSAAPGSGTKPELCISISPLDMETAPAGDPLPPWPSLSSCRAMVARFNGKLQQQGETTGTLPRTSLLIPLDPSVLPPG
ncbi:sensor histidine kinase [Desulfogranum mediterraneum]|uniref:hypothetical protein n=1 Tax=Desulfogranum mediterraneum TaxID=160661 RepID=UPI00041104A6|nr:hypothetical protein [Desulfogranum mediterraneum]